MYEQKFNNTFLFLNHNENELLFVWKIMTLSKLKIKTFVILSEA